MLLISPPCNNLYAVHEDVFLSGFSTCLVAHCDDM